MQVNGAAGRPPAGAARGADEVRQGAGRDAGLAFRRVIQRRQPLTHTAEPPPSAAALSGWFRAELPARQAATAPAPPVRAVDRVLVGNGPRGDEARIHIGAGPLAGTEIRLFAGGGVVEAQLLTRSESSRQTLAVALNEVTLRLRARGLVLRTTPTQPSRDASHEPPPREAPR